MKLSGEKVFSDWVIGVGASAGGLEALSQFIANLPLEFGGSLIVAQHLAPHSKSMMVELLARQAHIPVVRAENKMPIEPSTIYVVPPNHDIDIANNHIELTIAEEAVRPKPSIDELFISLAKNCKEKCVGIILSGTGTDGSKGIRAIKEAGGITLAQDDQSAKYDGMPRSAIETGQIDSIFPPDTLAKNIIRLISENESGVKSRRLDTAGLKQIYEVIKDNLDQDFSQYRPSTISRRVLKRMRKLNLRSYDEYAEHLKVTPGEVGELAKDLLISVTSFFRDPEVFDHLSVRLERDFQKETPHEFRAWIAGCATGEEAYTLAFILLELQNKLKKTFPIKIFATDLDFDAIQEGRNAVYNEWELKNVPTDITERYFVPRGDGRFEVNKRARDCVVFARQDLIQNPPFVKLDLISCRNVLIYFEPELQKKIIEIFHYALAPGGLLLLGKSESVLSAPQLFETLDRKTKLFEKINIASPPLGLSKVAKASPLTLPQPYRRAQAPSSLLDLGHRKLLKAFNIAGAIVDNEGQLLQVIGDVTPYFNLENFQADLRLPHLLQKNVGLEIPILIRKVIQDGEPHRSRTHKTRRGGSTFSYQLTVRALHDEDESGDYRFFLVSFEPKLQAKKEPLPTKTASEPFAENQNHVAELEQELVITKEHLQTVIEELWVSNEELQSLNEELSSTNEELQASNEELETTNEELQSSNEELTTANEELSVKTNEVRAMTLELENIQNSIGSPLIALDARLRLKLFNTEARKIFYISETDIGQEVTKISAKCEIPNFIQLAEKTLKTGQMHETQCDAGPIAYQLRFLPSFDENQNIIGIILNFIDNTDRIRTQERLRISEERIRAILDGSPSLVCLKDNMGRYLLVNKAFRATFGIDQDPTGKTDRELLPESTAIQFGDADLKVFITRASSKVEETIETSHKKTIVLLSSRFPIMDAAGRNPVAVGTISIDITLQVEAQRRLEKSENLYRAIAEDQAVLVCRHNSSGELIYANEPFNRYFGVDLKKHPRFLQLMSSRDREGVQNQLRGLNV